MKKRPVPSACDARPAKANGSEVKPVKLTYPVHARGDERDLHVNHLSLLIERGFVGCCQGASETLGLTGCGSP